MTDDQESGGAQDCEIYVTVALVAKSISGDKPLLQCYQYYRSTADAQYIYSGGLHLLVRCQDLLCSCRSSL